MIHASIACPLQAWSLRKRIHWGFAIGVAIVWLIAQLLGNDVLEVVDEVWLVRILGVGLLLIFFVQSAAQLSSQLLDHQRRSLPTKAQVIDLAAESVLASTSAATHSWYHTPGLSAESVTQSQRIGHADAEVESVVVLEEKDVFEAGEVSEPSILNESDDQLQSSLLDFQPSAQSTKSSFEYGSRENVIAALILALVGGFLMGLCGMPMPAILFYTLKTGIPKDDFRAAMSILQTLTMPVAAYNFFILHGALDTSQWQVYLASIIANILGLPLGNKISSYINQKQFRNMLLVFMFFGALMMATADTGTISVSVIGCLAVALGVAFSMSASCGKSRE